MDLLCWKIHDVFNESLLKPYTVPTSPRQTQNPHPPPELINGNEEYEVEEVLDSRVRRGG
ncbi:hypothetical protein AMATHDRAFT_11088 [Amanita thiersii Skay4041]|uniref:Uncharacterized protein n=1 Tax=Amanita thiersii Skay4041 TaxID=703135 RepID=A0A2A9N7H9_9AGAR|nr:hypothetical protein AMATHDRAFT_11088 [Amanita thiersii Skay4041]